MYRRKDVQGVLPRNLTGGALCGLTRNPCEGLVDDHDKLEERISRTRQDMIRQLHAELPPILGEGLFA